MKIKPIIGMGLRREYSEWIALNLPREIDCLEVAPENYLGTGGKLYRELCMLAKHYPIIFHGLSLSVGSMSPIDWEFLKKIKLMLRQFNAKWMSDHLCYSSLSGIHIHNLLPLPFTKEAVKHVVPRLRQVQDFLEMPFAIENVSYYAHPGKAEMQEWEFISEVLNQSGCSLLLDVNNVYVNSVNHDFDAHDYLNYLPADKVIQLHIAGHRIYNGFLLDHHGAEIIDPVWELLKIVVKRFSFSVLILERDNHMPPIENLFDEIGVAKKIVLESE